MFANDVTDANYYSHISTGTTTVVKTGEGILDTITLNTLLASATITIYDNTAASGTVIGIIAAGVNQGTYTYKVLFKTGLTIVTSGATDITVSYR